jgi:hypothetical protein
MRPFEDGKVGDLSATQTVVTTLIAAYPLIFSQPPQQW